MAALLPLARIYATMATMLDESEMGLTAARSLGPLRPMLAGLCATLLGVGLARFAYAPLLPAMVQAGWLSAEDAGFLGAANLAGYLVGALGAGAVARRFGLVRTMRAGMLIATLSFYMCTRRGDLAWFLPWRILAGFAGGLLMGLAGPAVQRVVPTRLHGLAGGMLFAGVGIGIMLGAVVVPAMLPSGLQATWFALGVAALALSVAFWGLWPEAEAQIPAARQNRAPRPGVGRLVALYAVSAVAATSHMVWWPDFIARGLGRGAASGGAFWFLYGAAVACCPTLFGRLADRLGARRALMALALVQVVALALPLLDVSSAALVASSIGGGGAAGGVSALALLRTKELAGDGAGQIWRDCTAAWGAAQAATGFGLAWLFAASGSHAPIFATGLVAAVLAAVLAHSKER